MTLGIASPSCNSQASFRAIPITPSVNNDKELHALIIGGGLAALDAASQILNRGYRVTVIAKQFKLTEDRARCLYDTLSELDGITLTTGAVQSDMMNKETSLLKQYDADMVVNAAGLPAVVSMGGEVKYPLRLAPSRIIHACKPEDAMLPPPLPQHIGDLADEIAEEVDHNRLPPRTSLVLILLANFLFNVSVYIVIPTATQYARSLGSTDLFSGFVIGGITLVSAVTLIPLNSIAIFRDYYRPTLDLAAGAFIIGNVLYGIAGYCDSLALLLIGRLVNGLGLTGWLFVKRYCTDPRIVGLRRRTMCSNLLVAAQTLGMVCGPLFGSFLAQIETQSKLFNGNTYPGHIMALVWLCYWILMRSTFHEVPSRSIDDIAEIKQTNFFRVLSRENWITTSSLSLAAFTVFFTLSAWESNIPIVGENEWNWGDSSSGVFIAVGGFLSFAFIFPVTWHAKRFQDRLILLVGLLLALLGELINCLSPLTRVVYGAGWVLVCWGMNLCSTITLSLTSKTLPDVLSDKAAIIIQLSGYCGRLLGSIWGTAGAAVGAEWIGWLDLLLTSMPFLLLIAFWRLFEARTG